MRYFAASLLALLILLPASVRAETVDPSQITPANGWDCGGSGTASGGRTCTNTDGRKVSCSTNSKTQIETCTLTASEQGTSVAEAYITQQVNGVIAQCGLTVQASEVSCVVNTATLRFAQCFQTGNDSVGARVARCQAEAVTAGKNAVASCVPGSTEEQRSCVLGLAAAATGPGAVQRQSVDSGFVPLTDIPAVKEITNANGGLTKFFNYLYVLAVGAAAIIAVLQFVRAGILYSVMSTGVVEKREARGLMMMSVLGLLLVLSPALVFGIINPDILSLRIGTTLGPAGSGGTGTGSGQQGGGGGTTPTDTPPPVNPLTFVVPEPGYYYFLVGGYDIQNSSVFNLRYYNTATKPECDSIRAAYAVKLEEERVKQGADPNSISKWYYQCEFLKPGTYTKGMPPGARLDIRPISG
jgi:hypothetical protein